MHFTVILRVMGILLMAYSMTMLPPALIALFKDNSSAMPFFITFLITLILGMLVWLPVHNKKQELRTKDGFLIVTLFWSVLGIFGAMPFVLTSNPSMSFTDAVFESMSGLTTTGSTVITGLDSLPKSILYYRQQLQWLGGMGIIVLAVAILPMLGIGGMQLYRAETPGPVKDSKLTPRITETAKALWIIYVSLTSVCALCYWLAGMDWFDAISHSFSTIAIGGFSTHDASIGYFNSPLIESICMFFMFIAGINFALHFLAWRSHSLVHYFSDQEFRLYATNLALMSVVTFCSLIYFQEYDSFWQALRYGTFETISIATTTGFATADFYNWVPLISTMLLIGSFMGGCAGSTGGGIKIIRILLMFKQWLREIRRLIHPSAVITIKLGRKPVEDRVIEAVWGFIGIYVSVFTLLLIFILATGVDFITGFSAVAATINNLGPGLGDVALHYGYLNDAAKWILCIAMLLGRLEVFTLLVIINPMFWRR